MKNLLDILNLASLEQVVLLWADEDAICDVG